MNYIKVLRWIGVLPIAIIAWFVTSLVLGLLYRLFNPVEMAEWAITTMVSGGGGFSFVYAGALTAPKGNRIVSIVLATIMTVITIISLVFALCGYGERSIIHSVLSCLSTITGCVFASIHIYEKK